MNNKKRAIVDREGLGSDEEEVEDLQAMEKIEEILCATYERKKGGPKEGTKGITPIQIIVSVEHKTPCATNTLERTSTFRQLNFRGINTKGNTSKKGERTGGSNLGSNNQLSTPQGDSSST
jgi:hypothetical protein